MSSTVTCKAIVQQGPRKDLQCTMTELVNDYCWKHQRNKEYDELIANNEIPCNMFFRGCKIIMTAEQLASCEKRCSSCRAKKNLNKINCMHLGCTNHIKTVEQKYCQLHQRDLLRDDEIKSGVKYCNIDRGCFNKLEGDARKCTECTGYIRSTIADSIQSLRKIHNIIVQPTTDILSTKQEEKLIEINELWRGLQRNAYSRELMISITRDEFEKMAIKPCYYCGFTSHTRLNGIDRIDNNKGYVHSNCISCCKMCNIMKQAQHPVEFLDKVATIVNFIKNGIPVSKSLITKWQTTYLTNKRTESYNEYKYKSAKRNEEFELSEQEFNTLRSLPCYLCGISSSAEHINGIDRYNPNIGYVLSNCKPCCTHCNIIKGQNSFIDLYTKCEQIVSYSCNQDIFEGLATRTKRSELRNEFYTANAIIEFMDNNKFDDYIDWCKEKEKSDIYISELNDIHKNYISHVINNNTAITQLQHSLDKERTSKTNKTQQKKFNATTIYSMLTVSGVDKFKTWYKTQHNPSNSFEKLLSTLITNLATVTKENGVELCRKFMEAEKNRRNHQKVRDKLKQENSTSDKDSTDTISSVYATVALVSGSATGIIADRFDAAPTLAPAPAASKTSIGVCKKNKAIPKELQHIKQEIAPPKQWKVLQIYNAILANIHAPYKAWCEETNELEGAEWEATFTQLLTDVRSTTSLEIAEPIIRAFIEELRRQRHVKLSAKINDRARPLDREERQQWPANTILKAYKKGEIAAFRKWLKEQDGEPIDADKIRWDSLIKQLEDNDTTDKEKQAIISKFLSARRARKYRASNS